MVFGDGVVGRDPHLARIAHEVQREALIRSSNVAENSSVCLRGEPVHDALDRRQSLPSSITWSALSERRAFHRIGAGRCRGRGGRPGRPGRGDDDVDAVAQIVDLRLCMPAPPNIVVTFRRASRP